MRPCPICALPLAADEPVEHHDCRRLGKCRWCYWYAPWAEVCRAGLSLPCRHFWPLDSYKVARREAEKGVS
jgi:hypothetical protein